MQAAGYQTEISRVTVTKEGNPCQSSTHRGDWVDCIAGPTCLVKSLDDNGEQDVEEDDADHEVKRDKQEDGVYWMVADIHRLQIHREALMTHRQRGTSVMHNSLPRNAQPLAAVLL